jgi:hypothetical protein
MSEGSTNTVDSLFDGVAAPSAGLNVNGVPDYGVKDHCHLASQRGRSTLKPRCFR